MTVEFYDLISTLVGNLVFTFVFTSACILQQEKPNYEKVVKYCDNVLELSPSNVKAMYRRGVAYYHLHDYDKAHTCLIQAKETKGQEKGEII